MSELTDSLRTHGLQHKGTHLGGLLQWAALHTESQDQALADLREEHAREENDRMQMEGALSAAKEAIEAALAAVNSPLRRPIELGRDMCGHINLMAAHGDPDYLLANGFNPRPPSLTGEPEERGMQIVGDVVFQSTPAIADGRTVFALSAKGQKQCFNPRPPSLTGEPFELLMRACAAEVSIHARHR